MKGAYLILYCQAHLYYEQVFSLYLLIFITNHDKSVEDEI